MTSSTSTSGNSKSVIFSPSKLTEGRAPRGESSLKSGEVWMDTSFSANLQMVSSEGSAVRLKNPKKVKSA